MKERSGIHYLILILACLSLYLQTLGFHHIELDDHKHIFENPTLLNPTFHGFQSFWTAPYFGLYIPVTYSLWFLVSLFSTQAFYFHALNLLLHTANSFLVLSLLRTLNFHRSLCLVGALIFSLHPIQVESVAWISASKDLLSTFFGLLTLLSLLKYRSLFLVGSLFVLALLSKPNIAFLPMLVLLMPERMVPNLKAPNSKLILTLFVAAGSIFLLTKFLQPDSAVQIKVDLKDRPLVAFDSLAFYLSKFFVPFELLLDYGRSPDKVKIGGINPIHIWTLFSTLMFFILSIKRSRFFFGFLFLIFSILPTSGIIPFQFQVFSTVADHYFYIGMVGVIIMVLDLLSRLNSKFSLSTSIVILLALWTLSAKQVQVWRNNSALFSHTLKFNPNSFLAHNNWAYSLYHSQQYEKAAQHFARASELRPLTPELFRNYGAALLKAGRTPEGLLQFRKAEQLSKPASQPLSKPG